MNIVIICPYFFPHNNPRAHRWRVMAEHWANQGHFITVFSSGSIPAHDLTHPNIKIIRKGNTSIAHTITQASNNRLIFLFTELISLFRGIFKLVWNFFYWPDSSFLWYFSIFKHVNKYAKQQKVDIMYSVSLPFTSHLVGLHINRKYPSIKWIVDIGDPFYFSKKFKINNLYLYKWINRVVEMKIIKSASKIFVTNEVLRAQYISQFHCDPSKIEIALPLLIENEGLLIRNDSKQRPNISLLYAGRFYNKVRPSFPIFRFLKQFYDFFPELKGHVIFTFYSELDDSSLTKSLLRELNHSVRIYPIISKKLMTDIYNQHLLVLNVSNLSDNQTPSKIPELINTGMPIVNFIYESQNKSKLPENYTHIDIDLSDQSTNGLVAFKNFIEQNKNIKVPDAILDDLLLKYKEQYISNQYLSAAVL